MKAQYNLASSNSIEQNFQDGLLPQRNSRGSFYLDTSCRSNLSRYQLSSENRRIIRKTEIYNYTICDNCHFPFSIQTQKLIYSWVKGLGWDFPISSVKNVFTNHIFNYFYTWHDSDHRPIAFAVCYHSPPTSPTKITSISYVFYDPSLENHDLPIRLTLQAVIDSYQQGFQYCYLGRFQPPQIGYYKRNMPGFEYFTNGQWLPFNSSPIL
jgi:hypothetical protein